jgi:hypothetical protein
MSYLHFTIDERGTLQSLQAMKLPIRESAAISAVTRNRYFFILVSFAGRFPALTD